MISMFPFAVTRKIKVFPFGNTGEVNDYILGNAENFIGAYNMVFRKRKDSKSFFVTGETFLKRQFNHKSPLNNLSFEVAVEEGEFYVYLQSNNYITLLFGVGLVILTLLYGNRQAVTGMLAAIPALLLFMVFKYYYLGMLANEFRQWLNDSRF